MPNIHPTAIVMDGARVADDAAIGPYCVIGPHVEIGAGCKLIAHVNVDGATTIGARTTIHPFASLGTPPQSLAHGAEITKLEIGTDCIIRESVTMNTGTVKGGGVTRVGDRGFYMANAHVAHDCIVGNDVVFANCATLGGHCVVGDFVFIGGLSAVHQFTRVGSQAMIGGLSGVRGDIIPFGLANGDYAVLEGLNIVGMRRRKFTRDRLQNVRAAYRGLFLASRTFAERFARFSERTDLDPAVQEIVDFIKAGAHRALCLPSAASMSAEAGD